MIADYARNIQAGAGVMLLIVMRVTPSCLACTYTLKMEAKSSSVK
jgi:hypothetical protein